MVGNTYRSLAVLAGTAVVILLVAACSSSADDACDRVSTLCANQPNITQTAKCDDMNDSQKEQFDKAADCIEKAGTCEAALGCLLGGGTGSSTSSTGGTTSGNGAPCDSAKCFAGNECLPLDGVEACRKTCTSNDDPATSCPFGYSCVSTDPENGVKPFCVESTGKTNDGETIQKKETGQWGSPCQANQGSKNPACDLDQGFYCYGISPTDGNAYCTRYDCEKDLDCGAGFACVDINTTPNVATAKKKDIGKTQKICQRRAYCSPCAADIDCPSIEGTAQHCITDERGRGFCTPECTANANCNNEAKCVTAKIDDATTAKVCYPRSKACIGEAKLCGSCLSDADCGTAGVCTHGQFTTEKFCITPAPGGDCTKCEKELTLGSTTRKIGCSSKEDDLYPANYCIGLVSIGGTVGSDIGCWTPDR